MRKTGPPPIPDRDGTGGGKRYLRMAAAGALFAVLALHPPAEIRAASFDCNKAHLPAEKIVCGNLVISKLDEELDALYHSVLAKASEEEKQALVAQQEHWLTHTRNVCEQEVCFKHAYWSRQAELATFFEPKMSLYAKESEKAAEIQKILTTEPLYGVKDNRPICNQVFTSLQQMQDIQFVDPVVQTTSYEDPALDTWKDQLCTALGILPYMGKEESEKEQIDIKSCGQPVLSFLYSCTGRYVDPVEELCADTRESLGLCGSEYLIPPYKIFMIPPNTVTGKTRYFFHSNNSCGPIDGANTRLRGTTGGRFYEFQLTSQCDTSARFIGPFDEHKLIRFQIMARGINYNSVIIHNQQYFLVVLEHDDHTKSYWLEIQPMDGEEGCRWSPVKQ